MRRYTSSPLSGGPRGLRRITAVVRQKRFSVALIALGILFVLAAIAFSLVPYDPKHDRITVWFWTTLAIAALELCLIAAWDWAAHRWHLLRLVTDVGEKPWPRWWHAILVPLCFVAGMWVDQKWVH